MSKTYTTKTFRQADQFKADHYNDEANNIAAEFNGKLGQQNMPVASVGTDEFVDVVRTTNAFGVNTTSSYFATQSYHYADWVVDNGSTTSAVVGPAGIYITDGTTDDWSPFYNTFDYTVVTEGARIRFDAKEGMIIGGVTISCEMRLGQKTVSTASVDTGDQNYYSIAVFLNGVMVAESGDIQIGGYTLDLPFSSTIGSEFCEIVVKWSSTIDEYEGDTPAEGYPNDDYRKFVVSGMSLYARNQYR